AGYGFAMSALRAASHTFDVMLSRPFGNALRFGLPVSLVALAICIALLLLCVWRTKKPPRQEWIWRFWRGLDLSMLVLFGGYAAYWLLTRAYGQWVEMFTFALPMLAYALAVCVLAEGVARVRNGEAMRTLYWARFFRVYPVWRLTGFFFAVLAVVHLGIFVLLILAEGREMNFWLSLFLWWLSMDARMRGTIDLRNFFFAFSGVSLVALTYLASELLRHSARHTAAAAEKLRAERFKSELITNVSHDIRTPLTSIINYVDLLKNEASQEKTAEYISVLERKAQRLNVLIGDLMEASKAGTGNVRVELRPVNLTEMVGQMAGEFDHAFTENKLTLVIRQPDAPVYLSADSRHLWRVLENLYANAAKYALPGTRVFAEITGNEGQVHFSLKNTSKSPIEMPGDTLTEQFIRGDRARHTEGSGLGLYIAKSLVELMGGTLTLRATGDLFEVAIMAG
ncbi:MAG: HAMP domain-containing histidine kinase, partial [Defluviitaleaceae bacterium]|nr:HAMP domain-containing histidine kinase [Defluviitaleaceae bacterium]